MTHLCYVAAFILLALATIAAAVSNPHANRWAIPLLAAGLALWIAPTALQLNS